MKFSLIISTRGRVEEMKRLLDSLVHQSLQDFEIIISDQNEDDRLAQLAIPPRLEGRVLRLRNSGGLSRGRNEGIKHARGEILGFPDDDCSYPPELLRQVGDFFESHSEFGFLSGRSYADDGKDSVSRHAKVASPITRYGIHTQCIEFAIFIRRSGLEEVRFDENMGVGSPSPWQSDEGPDLLLRLLERGVRGYYEPALGVWHPRPVTRFDQPDIDRTYRYACGNGYFYRKHHYPGWYFAYQMFKTATGLLVALATLKGGKARLRLARLRGRWRGWRHSQEPL